MTMFKTCLLVFLLHTTFSVISGLVCFYCHTVRTSSGELITQSKDTRSCVDFHKASSSEQRKHFLIWCKGGDAVCKQSVSEGPGLKGEESYGCHHMSEGQNPLLTIDECVDIKEEKVCLCSTDFCLIHGGIVLGGGDSVKRDRNCLVLVGIFVWVFKWL